MEGKEVEWTLGFLLSKSSSDAQSESHHHEQEGGEDENSLLHLLDGDNIILELEHVQEFVEDSVAKFVEAANIVQSVVSLVDVTVDNVRLRVYTIINDLLSKYIPYYKQFM